MNTRDQLRAAWKTAKRVGDTESLAIIEKEWRLLYPPRIDTRRCMCYRLRTCHPSERAHVERLARSMGMDPREVKNEH